MSSNIALLDSPSNLPAHLQGFKSTVSTDLMAAIGGTLLNRIGLKGNRFRSVIKGEEVGVFDENYLDIIVVGAAPDVSRIFYPDAYKSGGDNAGPLCYSVDGIAPPLALKTRQSDACATCQWNVKGSRISENGIKSRACGFFRRLVVMLAGDPEGVMYKLDVKSMGLFGESFPKQGKFALNDYAKAISSRGLDVGTIVTRISFDTDQSVPKLLFSPQRFISEDEMTTITGLHEGTELEQYMEISMHTVDLAKEDAHDEPVPEAAPEVVKQKPQAPKPQAPKPQAPKPKVAPIVVEEDGAIPEKTEEAAAAAAVKAAPRPVPQKPQAPKPQAPKPQAVHTAPAATAAPAPQVTEISSDADLAAMLGDMGL